MNKLEALRRVESVTSPMTLPPQARNKSWLFVFVDETRNLHFYDVKGSPREAFERIATAKPRHEMLDVMAFTSPDEAKNVAISLSQARALLDYYGKMVAPVQPIGAPPAAAGGSNTTISANAAT